MELADVVFYLRRTGGGVGHEPRSWDPYSTINAVLMTLSRTRLLLHKWRSPFAHADTYFVLITFVLLLRHDDRPRIEILATIFPSNAFIYNTILTQSFPRNV